MPNAPDPPPRSSVGATAVRDTPRTAPTAPGRKGTLKELLQLPQIPLGVLAAVDTVKNGQGDPNAISPYALDMQTLAMYTDPLADALTDLADKYPQLGAFLDRVGMATPFAAILSVGIGMACQFAENHGALTASMRSATGTIPRADLAQMIRDENTAKSNGQG